MPVTSEQDLGIITHCGPLMQVIARVRRKTATFGRDYTADGPVQADGKEQQYKVQPDTVASLFRDWVMPLTKEVEVMYLLRRLEWDS